MLFISNKTWNRIRDEFSEDEKATLRSVILNDVIGPIRGVDLDVDLLDAGLQEKVLARILEHTPAVRTK